jgi:amino acid permease
MKRIAISVLNLILIVIGFLIIYTNPISALAITVGMVFISISIISFAVLIYFPPSKQEYVKLKVVEEAPKTPSRPKTKRKPKKKPQRSRRR